MTSEILRIVTLVSVAIIIIAAILALFYVQKQSKSGELIAKRRWIQQLPSMISTLGVLGTFFGITIGLIYFDTSDLDNSIPLLLEGLKTAFFTSLAGMIGSLVLSRQVSKLFDDEDKGVSDVNQAAGLIAESVRKMSDNNVKTLETMMNKSEEQTVILRNLQELLKTIGIDELKEKVTTIEENSSIIGNNLSQKIRLGIEVKDIIEDIRASQTKIESAVSDNKTSVESINKNVLSTLEVLGNINISEQHVSEKVDSMSTNVQREIKDMNDVLKTQLSEVSQFIAKQNAEVADNILSTIKETNSKADEINKILTTIQSETADITSINDKVQSSLGTLGTIDDIKKILTTIQSETSNISSINDNVLSSLEALGNLDLSEQHVSEKVDAMSANIQREIKDMNNVLKTQLSEVSQFIAKQNTEVANNILTCIRESNSKTDDIKKVMDAIQSETANITSINDNVLSSLEALGNLDLSEQHVSEEIDNLGVKMTGDIDHIASKMDSTNDLLDSKFTEFSELLAKNNTDMMVDVMRDMAQQFQLKMNEVINKLVHDNFEDLKHSIDRLNLWQKENKDIVAGMIDTYRKMQNSFEHTSSTLSDVGAKTEELVADDGKLHQLIDSLNKVMLENKNFERIINDLQEAALINKENANKLNSTSSNLESWIKRQKDFATGIEQLMTKLDEINRIKDYGSDFWKETRKQFEEGINLITEAGQKLNNNIGELDKHFYSRLSITLSNLDACIQAMYDAKLSQNEKK